MVWAWSKSTIWKLWQFFFTEKFQNYSISCLFGKKCDQSWCRKADFFFNFFLSWNFWNISKTKSSSKIFLLYKSLFQVLGYLLKFEFLLYLKKYSLEPHAEKWGQNRSTGISRVRKNLFFKISKNLKLQIKNEKYVLRNWPSSQIKIFTLSCKLRKGGVIPVMPG